MTTIVNNFTPFLIFGYDDHRGDAVTLDNVFAVKDYLAIFN